MNCRVLLLLLALEGQIAKGVLDWPHLLIGVSSCEKTVPMDDASRFRGCVPDLEKWIQGPKYSANLSLSVSVSVSVRCLPLVHKDKVPGVGFLVSGARLACESERGC